MDSPLSSRDLLHQVHLGSGGGDHAPITTFNSTESACDKTDIKTIASKEQSRFGAELRRQCPEDVWPPGSLDVACARPFVATRQHERRVEDLNEALVLAVTDIVGRWWKDDDARYYERMPLEGHEEALLRWIEGQVDLGNLPKYPERLGSWRPDYMVETYCENGAAVEENFRITEINARFAFNAWIHSMHVQNALRTMCLQDCGANCAADGEEFFNGLLQLFDPKTPLHLLKGRERGLDIHMFIHEMEQRLGISPRLISPADLRLISDPSGKSEWLLCCLVSQPRSEDPTSAATNGNHTNNTSNGDVLTTSTGELVEEIHQVGLELHQNEIAALEPELLRQITLRCFNDMRTILLVHDKRMLGIIKQDCPALVARKVLTAEQARVLDLGIADTYLPGSPEIRSLLDSSRLTPDVRLEYLLKPVRGGKGAGIRFGDEISADEWLSTLERLSLGPEKLDLGEASVVQRVIVPRLYDVILDASGSRHRYPLNGTFPVANGKVRGWGTWRISKNRICAVSNGGALLGALMKREGN